jgi:hypothetical protein
MKLILLAAIASASEDALEALGSALQDSNYIVGAVALVIILALAVLKMLKKDFPFVEPAAKLLLGIAKIFKPKAKEDPAKEEAAQPGLAQVVPLEKPANQDQEQK